MCGGSVTGAQLAEVAGTALWVIWGAHATYSHPASQCLCPPVHPVISCHHLAHISSHDYCINCNCKLSSQVISHDIRKPHDCFTTLIMYYCFWQMIPMAECLFCNNVRKVRKYVRKVGSAFQQCTDWVGQERSIFSDRITKMSEIRLDTWEERI